MGSASRRFFQFMKRTKEPKPKPRRRIQVGDSVRPRTKIYRYRTIEGGVAIINTDHDPGEMVHLGSIVGQVLVFAIPSGEIRVFDEGDLEVV